MKHRIPISTILLGVAVASVQAQGPTAISQDDNLRYSQSRIITLIEGCAPGAAPNTMLAVATTESALHPYAVSVNRPTQIAQSIGLANSQIQLARQPRSRREAIQWMRWLLAHGVTVSVGLLQVNTENAGLFHLRPEQLFDPCTNIAVGSALLAQAYAARTRIAPNDPNALLYALSVYNSGTYNLGFQNGYVAEVLKNAKP
ncbi:MAG: lytic transglycosylase domain-containing protein [Terracidiphilus sp.]|jgi:type IV secretion system protein VirB1